jgi:hypothetical protein
MTREPMTPDELRARMHELLDQERDAIRRMDVEALMRATDAKTDLIARVRAAAIADRGPLVTALGEFKDDLRRNLVLLAHARDAVAEAIELCGSSVALGGRPRLSAKL